MDDIFNGVYKFQNEDYEKYKNLFVKLKDGQNPHTLFVGCSDSRVVPALITKTLPGELFMVRNIANIVPPYRETQEYVATTSAIEFAVQALNVTNIVVCGHSNCGGCASLYKTEEELKDIPHVKKWLELAQPARKYVLNNIACVNDFKRDMATEKINVIQQINNLSTYPFIKEKYAKNTIKIYGWYYIIGTGEVYNYNKENGYYELITP
jgi:carbonic anhydrase